VWTPAASVCMRPDGECTEGMGRRRGRTGRHCSRAGPVRMVKRHGAGAASKRLGVRAASGREVSGRRATSGRRGPERRGPVSRSVALRTDACARRAETRAPERGLAQPSRSTLV
jgi:hypothetical protein